MQKDDSIHMRLSAAQKEKLMLLGGANWFRRQIDRAPQPEKRHPYDVPFENAAAAAAAPAYGTITGRGKP